jgi:hypothetical protein
MDGFYRFYRGNELICEQKNSLTTVGRSLILKSIMGLIPSIGGAIVAGTDGTSNPAPDSVTKLINLNSMGFSVISGAVSLTSLDATGSTDALIFKTTIDDAGKYSIYEVGLYPSPLVGSPTISSKLLYSGAASDGWVNDATLAELEDVIDEGESRIVTTPPTNTSFRVGLEATFLKAGDTIYSTSINDDLSLYGDKDVLKIAVDTTSTSGSPTLTIKFEDGAGSYVTKTFTLSTYGYQILSCTKDAINTTVSGSIDWTNIAKVSLSSTVGGFIIDGIRFDDVDNIDPNYGLVSRAALATPIIKNAGEPITIEYYLTLAFNRT